MEDDKKAYSLTYDRAAIAEFAQLGSFWQDAARAAIEDKLLAAPETFGKPLRHSLKGCRALRIGQYRIVFQIHRKTIRIIALIHRSEGYEGLEKRL